MTPDSGKIPLVELELVQIYVTGREHLIIIRIWVVKGPVRTAGQVLLEVLSAIAVQPSTNGGLAVGSQNIDSCLEDVQFTLQCTRFIFYVEFILLFLILQILFEFLKAWRISRPSVNDISRPDVEEPLI